MPTNLPIEKRIKGGPGRPKGAKGKFTTLKAAFLEAFQDIETSHEPLVKWAKKKENKGDFYQMVARMLPKTIEGNLKSSGRLIVCIRSEKGKDGDNTREG